MATNNLINDNTISPVMEQYIIAELKKRWVTKEELSIMLGFSPKGNGERKARLYIEELTKKLAFFNLCVLSTSARKGYHIPDPNNSKDVSLAKHSLEELRQKAISIFERRKIIANFCKHNHIEEEVKQLTLF